MSVRTTWTVTAALLLWGSSASAWTPIYQCNAAWPDNHLPVRYNVNENAPDELRDLDQIRRIYRESFEAWSAPCCSRWAVEDAGLTQATGRNQQDRTFTLSFIEGQWPRELGDVNSTLGVTMPLVTNRCEIVSADVVFNSTGFAFIEGNPRAQRQADLGSIATHEFGHFLGLGHTPVFEATMYAAYTGGISARSLHQDDIDGVCTLYQTPCNCEGDRDCTNGRACIEGTCQVPPCEGDGDCDPGLVCQLGDCITPPCENDGDCAASYICDAGTGVCRPDANCPICATGCDQNGDCGPNGVCIPPGALGAESVCTKICQGQEDCPGTNTACFTVPTDQGDVNLCFNDSAPQAGPCPGGFLCEDDNAPSPCDGVQCGDGQQCNRRTGDCEAIPSAAECKVCEPCQGAAADECGPGGRCLMFPQGGFCSVPCAADGTCPTSRECFQLQDNAGNTELWCLNANAQMEGLCTNWTCDNPAPIDPCEGVSCDPGSACADGQCVPDPLHDGGVDTGSRPDSGLFRDGGDRFAEGGVLGDGGGPALGGDLDDSEGVKRVDSGGGGCACSSAGSGAGAAWLLLLAGAALIRRRR